ncbi:MAG: hypothetical protein ACRD3F_09300 [Acidobacteriaceae bacterium]
MARRLLRLIAVLDDEGAITDLVADAARDFENQNKRLLKKGNPPLPDSQLAEVARVLSVTPMRLGVLDAADNWVVESMKDVARMPSDSEWDRLQQSPLDGQIGMSFALQWRYNFGRVFGAVEEGAAVPEAEVP